MTRPFESKKTKGLVKESLAEIVARCSKLQFCKVTRETTQKGPTLNAKFNPLHLYHLKNLLDLGLIYGEIQRRGAQLVGIRQGGSTERTELTADTQPGPRHLWSGPRVLTGKYSSAHTSEIHTTTWLASTTQMSTTT